MVPKKMWEKKTVEMERWPVISVEIIESI
jgi:hypothetical protein